VEPQRAEHFAYFMIRVHRGALVSAEGTLTGLIEQLATGEKESFASAEELIRIVRRWPETPARYRAATAAEQEQSPGAADDANERAGR
jgi:hypothetical protein